MPRHLLASLLAALSCWTGCFTSASHPPELGDCIPQDDGGCQLTPTGGSLSGGDAGSSGAQGADAASCTVSAGQSQCDQCAYADCCADITACFTSAACTSLYDCIAGCAGSPACVKACSSQYPQAQLAYQQLASCVSLRCPVCSEAGAGDPCAGGVACVTGLSCSGSWCTRSCTATSDCAGIGPGGGNYTGQPGACVHLPGGFECVPGCSTDADCSAFEGTYCEQTTSVEGVAVSVCGALPDGG